jgi:hypothetical protein
MTYLNEDGRAEPPIAGDKTPTLLGSLERQRAIFAWKCGGLATIGLRATVGACHGYCAASMGAWPDVRRHLERVRKLRMEAC